MHRYDLGDCEVTFVPLGHAARPNAPAWVVDTERVGRVPEGATYIHVVPQTSWVGRKDGARHVASRVVELEGDGRAARGHAHALHAVRHVTHATQHDVVCHVADGDRAVRDYLAFREALPALVRDPEAAESPAMRGTLALMARTRRFAKLVRSVGPPAFGRRPSSFATISRAIVYQQLTGRAAGTIWERFAQSLPGCRVTPEAVLARDVPALRAVGLSNNKAKSLLDLAAHIHEGRLKPRALRRMSDDDVIDALVQVRGIGPWSAHMHLMFCLERLDVWPTGDLGVRKGLQTFFKLPECPDEKQAATYGARFAPYRSIAAWYMWRVLELDEWR